MGNKKLETLYKKVDGCKFCKTTRNKLQHIHGFGAINPRLMLILINPTYRNLSSRPGYKGIRFPFIGVRQFWRVLADGGLINKKVAYGLPKRSDWDTDHTRQIQKELIKNKFFLTNIVKCCYSHGKYPSREVIHDQLNILKEEVRLVNPKYIVAFGALVFKTLTGKNIKMSDYLRNFSVTRIVSEKISGLDVPVILCYFPIGRGNPRESAKILREFLRV